MSQAQLYHGPVIMHLGRSRPRMGMRAGLICLSVAHTALACDASLLSMLAPLRFSLSNPMGLCTQRRSSEGDPHSASLYYSTKTHIQEKRKREGEKTIDEEPRKIEVAQNKQHAGFRSTS